MTFEEEKLKGNKGCVAAQNAALNEEGRVKNAREGGVLA